MKSLFVILCVFVASQPVVSWACMPGTGQFQNYKAKQSDTCYQIINDKHVNLCTDSIRVFFDSNSTYIDPEIDPTPFGQPYGAVLAPGEIIDGTPIRMGCYPDACQEELTLVVGPADVAIDENYLQNDQLAIYTYTYEVINERPVDCNSEEEPPIKQENEQENEQPNAPSDASTGDDGGCHSTSSSPVGGLGLLGFVLLGVFRRRRSSR